MGSDSQVGPNTRSVGVGIIYMFLQKISIYKDGVVSNVHRKKNKSYLPPPTAQETQVAAVL